MKKITLLLLLITIANNSYSQVTYFNYLDYTSEWRSYNGGWNGLNAFDSYETRYFDGDETINGIAYYKEYSITITTEYNPPFGSTYSTTYYGGPYYVREDASGKFYRINANNGNEDIILDNQVIVNSQIGDIFPYQGGVCTVQTIENVSLGANILKKIKGSNTENNKGALEGVGVLGLACGSAIETDGGINCYTKQGVNLQFGTISCSSFPVPLRLSTNNNNFNSNKIIVYPNPTNGILKIKYNSQEAINFEIYNMQGAILTNGSIESETQLINISNFSTGMYVIKVGNGNSAIYRKIVKE